jgi:membrane-associated protease RseP (regulator of RpoE activity)
LKKISFYVEPFAPAGLFLLLFSWDAVTRAAIVASVLAHELSHLAAMKMCAGKVEGVRLTAFGISLSFSAPKTYAEEIFVAAAGPVSSFAFAALGYFRGGAFGEQAAVFSLFLGILNLLPIASFDGHRILSGALCLAFDSEVSEKVMYAVSLFFLFVLWLAAVYILFYSGANFVLLLFCAYIFVFSVIKRDCNFTDKMIQ